MFGSIVYIGAVVNKHQTFHKVFEHVTITDQCNQSVRRIFIAALFLSLWRQSAVDRGLSVKPGLGHLGHWQTMYTPRSDAAERGV